MNIIEVFQRGNQELFHSAFIAWLLNKDGEHGLGDSFAKKLMKRINYDAGRDYTVYVEPRERNARYDILVEPKKGGKLLVLENKMKSFGNEAQLSSYNANGHKVALLAFLKETIEDGHKFDVIYYRDLLKDLGAQRLIEGNHYHFLIKQYMEFINKHLSVYEAIKGFCLGQLSWKKATQAFVRHLEDSDLRDNDVRTYNYFYYYNFARYLKEKSSDLIFGDLWYDEAEKKNENTEWYYEKNMQGPPFMEALIYNPTSKSIRFHLNSDLKKLYKEKKFIIAPRIEIWLDPNQLADKPEDSNQAVGLIMMGTWSEHLKDYLLEKEPYKSELVRKGSRNFHFEDLSIKDLRFENLEQRIGKMLAKIGSFDLIRR